MSVFSDDRFRGYSLSDSRPVAIIDLSYDSSSGFYGALSGSLVATSHDGLQPLGIQLNGGYAKRVSPNLSLDFGVIHSEYSTYASGGDAQSYTEAYAGLTGKVLSGRVTVSPDYLQAGAWSAYGEIHATVPAGSRWRFSGHVGLLVPLRCRIDYERYRSEFDWRLGISRDFGPVTANVSWSGTRHREDRYPYQSRATRGLVAGLTYAL